MHILFDIDQTLIISEKTANQFSKRYHSHLEDIGITLEDLGLSIAIYENDKYFIINRIATAKLFSDLLANNIKIGFVTASIYQKEHCLKIFECIYELPDKSLENCVFINRNDYSSAYYNFTTNKAEKIRAAQQDGLIDQHVILLDDCDYQIESARKAGFEAIVATGFKTVDGIGRPRVDCGYVDKVRLVCGI